MYGGVHQISSYIHIKQQLTIRNAFTGQLSLAIPPWVGALSTSRRAVMLCSLEVKAGMVRAWVAGKTV